MMRQLSSLVALVCFVGGLSDGVALAVDPSGQIQSFHSGYDLSGMYPMVEADGSVKITNSLGSGISAYATVTLVIFDEHLQIIGSDTDTVVVPEDDEETVDVAVSDIGSSGSSYTARLRYTITEYGGNGTKLDEDEVDATVDVP